MDAVPDGPQSSPPVWSLGFWIVVDRAGPGQESRGEQREHGREPGHGPEEPTEPRESGEPAAPEHFTAKHQQTPALSESHPGPTERIKVLNVRKESPLGFCLVFIFLLFYF